MLASPAQGDEDWWPLIPKDEFELWTQQGESKAHFTLIDEVVTGQPIGHHPKNAFLCSPREYEDFELRFFFRIEPTSLNSGVQFRSRINSDGIVAGPQLEMDLQSPDEMSFMMRWVAPWLVKLTDEPWRLQLWPAGGVYGEALSTGWIYPGVAGGDSDSFRVAGEQLSRPQDWNELRLLADGDRVSTWLNGELRADYLHPETAGAGLICLQVHGGDYEDPSAVRVQWRDLQIREF
ncbi:MAG: DUF1080 domain-containing protein [Halioglobus sp.]|nr:DUF1080 domain-containing protein [Halioglobus sp.]